MKELRNNNLFKKVTSLTPVILLFFSVLNDFDFNYLGIKYFSFNFSFILIFYYSLKKSESLGYVLIFVAFLLLCGAATYLRNITLRPNIIKDWIFFLLSILVINSLSFIILNLIFNYKIIYLDQLINTGFTFVFYLFFSYFFYFFEKFFLGNLNAR